MVSYENEPYERPSYEMREQRENREKTAAAITAIGNTGMQKLIPIVNKIQDVCTQLGTHLVFDIPQIAVVGSQSAGKSSVLENFVGRDFLPRGSGIVTRRPLILQLINGPEEYGEFAHCRDKRFTNFADIRSEITAETDRATGKNKGVSSIPINLCIHSPNVLNLTLIDLPGVTKIPVGDQPDDIEAQVREMILEYISKENCLILAVSPANVDLATSDALKLAREVDKDGTRTIGVITKLDLMDDGTDARDIFENKLLPLRRGYIGVVNRSQKDIDNQKDISEAMKYEQTFFKRHSYYRHIMDRLGTSYLQQVLNRQLTEHIRKTLPMLQDKLRKQMVTLEKKVTDFKHSHPDDPVIMKKVMVEVLQQLQIDFQKEIGSLGATVIDTERLSSGAKIKRIFHERLPAEIYKIQHDKAKVQKEIYYAIENLHGIDVGLYPPLMAFEAIVRMQISELEKPIVQCVDLVIEELSHAVRMCTQRISSYPSFRDNIENHIMTYIHSNGLLYQQNILSLIKMEASYMNTRHDDFFNSCKSPRSRSDSFVKITHTSESGGTPSDNKDSDSNAKGPNSKPHNVVIRKGNFQIQNYKNEDEASTTVGDPSDSLWFVLTFKTLTCFKNGTENENEKLLTITLDGLKLRDSEENSAKHIIALFNPNGQSVHPDYEELELLCKSAGKFNSWKESFNKALNGEESVTQTISTEVVDMEDMSPPPEDIFDIYDKIDSYMRIVKKTVRDMVPKAITLYIIRELEKYINTELLMVILNVPNDNYAEMFAADPQNTEKFEETKKMHETCEKALDEIIRI